MRHDLPILDRIVPVTEMKGINKLRGIYSSGFEEKKLGTHVINLSLNCEVKCGYCSSPAVLGQVAMYRDHVADWWSTKTLIYYENILASIERDAQRLGLRKDVEVVLSTVVDPYQRVLVKLNFLRRVYAALAPTEMKLRVLTKLTAVARDLELLLNTFGDRVTVGTSIPILDDKLARVVEPFAASPTSRQRRILGRAKELGLRRFVMACPILPGVYPNYGAFVADWAPIVNTYDPEEIWFEPLNARGRNIDVLEGELTRHGYTHIASSVRAIRSNEGWSHYNAELLDFVQRFARQHFSVHCTHYLLYQRSLTKAAAVALKKNDACVIWLGGTR